MYVTHTFRYTLHACYIHCYIRYRLSILDILNIRYIKLNCMQSFNFHNRSGIINCWSFDDCIGRKIHVRIDSTVDRHGYHRSCYSVIRILCNLTHPFR